MKKSFLLLIGIVLSVFSPLALADTKNFQTVFDQRNAAVQAGNLDGVLAVMSARLKKDAETELSTADKKKGALDFWKQTLVSPYTVEGAQASPDGKKGILFLSGEVTNLKGKRETMEQQIEFVKEGGGWKIDGVLFGASTSKIKRAKDDGFEPEDRFDSSKSTNLGGRIIKTEYKDTYTVVTIRVLDEENLIYLPSKAELIRKKIAIGNFEPGKAYSFDAYPHKTNKLKFWGSGGEPVSYFNN